MNRRIFEIAVQKNYKNFQNEWNCIYPSFGAYNKTYKRILTWK